MSDGCSNKAPLKLRISWKIDELKRNIENKRIQKHIKYITTKASKDSNYVKHALNEMKIAWPEAFAGGDACDDIQKLMCDQVIEILALLSTQGDSGTSIGYKLNLLNRLAKFGIISPLTFEESEWGEVYDMDRGTRQNKRCSRVFHSTKETNDKLKYYNIDGIFRTDKYFVKEDENGKLYMDIDEHPGGWTGSAFVIKPDGSLRYCDLRAYIKNPKSFDPNKKFYIPSYQVQYPEGWWISFVREEDLAVVKDTYNIKYASKSATEKLLENEINFRDGKYADEIRKRIDFVIKYNTKPFKKTLKTYVKEQRANKTSRD